MDTSYLNDGRKRKRPTPPTGENGRSGGNASFYSTRDNGTRNGARPRPVDEQVRLNQIQEDERMREWVAQEDEFVLKQSKKKAAIRAKDGRAKPIDFLAILLRIIDPTTDLLDNEINDDDLDFVEPEAVFKGLDDSALTELEKDISTYLSLEKNRRNKDFWRTMLTICRDERNKSRQQHSQDRVVGSVAADIDELLHSKSHDDLQKLEAQIERKLASRDPIDTDYWQQLLESLIVRKAKAKLKILYQDVLDGRRRQAIVQSAHDATTKAAEFAATNGTDASGTVPGHFVNIEPQPLLSISVKDRGLEVLDEKDFLDGIARERSKASKLEYSPAKRATPIPVSTTTAQLHANDRQSFGDNKQTTNADQRTKTLGKALFEREVARGVDEDEEVFAGEENVETKNKDSWVGKHRPRKPRYFNRVQMGYEWNKYNQTHYDHDNPPPKVVQGYKFHVFYPDLLDKTKAPVYRILREGGRKKGQSSAPAGEEDTCIIRFDSGPPYESIAFRIVDRDWDYSAKHDRGFRSTFDNDILTLYFSFKKIFYRK